MPNHSHVRAVGPHPAYPPRGRVRSIPWTQADDNYTPITFTHPTVLKNATESPFPYADRRCETSFADTRMTIRKRGRSVIKKTLRTAGAWHGEMPRNPVGRTGITGRGLLGKFGANQAADPIVTRYRPNSSPPILEMVAIKRRDTGEYAIPGGMTEGKPVSDVLLREFKEEALAALEGNPSMTKTIEKAVDNLFSNGTLVYAGYVDDPRNTDNAWMETTVKHFHIDDSDLAAALPLMGGDDAVKATWIAISPLSMVLYASHAEWVESVSIAMERRMRMRSASSRK